MRICVFEDSGVRSLEPLSLTRPAFDLWCGSAPLLERQRRHFAAAEAGALVRPALAGLCGLTHPELAVNDPPWLREETTALVNARWLPPADLFCDGSTPRVALAAGQVAFAVVPSHGLTDCLPETLAGCLERWKRELPEARAGGSMIRYPWELVERNADTLRADFGWRAAGHRGADRPPPLQVVGPPDRVVVDADARIEPFVVADTTCGPVFIDRGAVVHAFSRLEGPCYVGPESRILGAKLRGGTVGPGCRVGGEVEASIIQGYSNKVHEGFLGHSYVGEWVNLAAGTQVSDLRNDYGPVRVAVAGELVHTGLTKVGAFLGDHTKTGLNTLLNTGTVAGAFSHLLPAQTFLPRVIPSFCTFSQGRLQERADFGEMILTAARVMQRRGREWTRAHRDFFFTLYDQTTAYRRRVVQEGERRLAAG
jgi:UDP-N-acetylglucosamine diphosphorylase/glucosamine-1-phosphate N-acetyltransferase